MAASTKLEFDPNNPAKQAKRPVWATYIPSRRGPDFKQHNNRGNALNALGMGSPGILYHWETRNHDFGAHAGEGIKEQWVEVARVENVYHDNCERCEEKLRHGYVVGGDNSGSYPNTVWIGIPKLRYVTVCDDCHFAILYPLKNNPDLHGAWYDKYNRSNKRKVDQREL